MVCEFMKKLLEQPIVHVWYCDLKVSGSRLARYTELLSPDELSRAQRFRFTRDKQNFIVARGVLRVLLGHYCQCPANKLSFHYAEHGKPYLQTQHNFNNVTFNLAHSHDISVYAFMRYHAIGIDIEYIQRNIDELTLAKQFFAKEEYQQLVRLSQEQQHRGFFNGWTRKEAFIKALGDGLFYPLNRFVVSLTPEQPAKVISIDGDEQAAQAWTLAEFTPKTNYVGAIASNRNIETIAYYQWEHDTFI